MSGNLKIGGSRRLSYSPLYQLREWKII